jgi:hypothetical protein
MSMTLNPPGQYDDDRNLRAGCGNGVYLRALAGKKVRAAGCDLSMGMLRGGRPPGGGLRRRPAPLRIPHTSVIRPQPPDVTTQSLRVHPGYHWL